jgi:hypothetical protein
LFFLILISYIILIFVKINITQIYLIILHFIYFIFIFVLIKINLFYNYSETNVHLFLDNYLIFKDKNLLQYKQDTCLLLFDNINMQIYNNKITNSNLKFSMFFIESLNNINYLSIHIFNFKNILNIKEITYIFTNIINDYELILSENNIFLKTKSYSSFYILIIALFCCLFKILYYISFKKQYDSKRIYF